MVDYASREREIQLKKVYVFESVVNDRAKKLVNDVLNSGWIGLGGVTAELEKEFAAYMGRKYAVAVNSCTSALHLCVKLVKEMGKQNLLIGSPLTFISSNLVALYEDMTILFVDIDPSTLNMDMGIIQELKVDKEDAIVVPVHYGGRPIGQDELKSCPYAMVEDCAHSAGATYSDGRKVGCVGDLSVYSFHAVKNISSPDGGMILTDNEEYYNKLMKMRWLGIDKSTYQRINMSGYSWDYDVNELGYKYHMNDVAAAICLGHLSTLEQDNNKRLEIIRQYEKRIDSRVNFPVLSGDCSKPSGHLATCILPAFAKIDKVIPYLNGLGVYPGVHYKPNYKHKVFCNKFVCVNKGGGENSVGDVCEVAESLHGRLLTLPCHMKMDHSDLVQVIDAMNSAIDLFSRKAE